MIENFDLTFGANNLIQDAELNLAKGKRYGLGMDSNLLIRSQLKKNSF